MSWGESPAALGRGPGATNNQAIIINAVPATLTFLAFLKSTLLRFMIQTSTQVYGASPSSLTASPPTRLRQQPIFRTSWPCPTSEWLSLIEPGETVPALVFTTSSNRITHQDERRPIVRVAVGIPD